MKGKIISWICTAAVIIFKHRYTAPKAIERTITYLAFHALLGL